METRSKDNQKSKSWAFQIISKETKRYQNHFLTQHLSITLFIILRLEKLDQSNLILIFGLGYKFIWVGSGLNKWNLYELWDLTSAGKENEAFLIRVWKPLPDTYFKIVRLVAIRNESKQTISSRWVWAVTNAEKHRRWLMLHHAQPVLTNICLSSRKLYSKPHSKQTSSLF